MLSAVAGMVMYSLPYFKEKDMDVIMEFIHDHPFAFITGCDENKQPVATQIPVFIENQGDELVLRGHMMKNTDHHKAFIENKNVLVVFTGPHAYVSATWYSDPHQASTWNYMAVYISGTIRFLDDNALIDVLRKVTLHFENHNSASTTVYDNLDDNYKFGLMKAIAAFEIKIKSIENVFKLSQNRDRKSYENIIDKLEQQGGSAAQVASEMKKRTEELFENKN